MLICKCSFLILFLILITRILLYNCSKSNEEDDEALDAVEETFKKSKNLYKTKGVNYFTNYYALPNPQEIGMNTANLMKADANTKRSFNKLNAIANNVKDGDVLLKMNPTLSSTLKLMLSDNSMKPEHRVNAAKLAARLENIPVSIQMVSDSPTKKPKNFDSYVIVPRVKRLYRPDYYVENYKAGNWGL